MSVGNEALHFVFCRKCEQVCGVLALKCFCFSSGEICWVIWNLHILNRWVRFVQKNNFEGSFSEWKAGRVPENTWNYPKWKQETTFFFFFPFLSICPVYFICLFVFKLRARDWIQAENKEASSKYHVPGPSLDVSTEAVVLDVRHFVLFLFLLVLTYMWLWEKLYKRWWLFVNMFLQV